MNEYKIVWRCVLKAEGNVCQQLGIGKIIIYVSLLNYLQINKNAMNYVITINYM